MGTRLGGLAVDGELMSFTHKGFWQPMDTLRDKLFLEELLEQGKAPEDMGLNKGKVYSSFGKKKVFITGHTVLKDLGFLYGFSLWIQL